MSQPGAVAFDTPVRRRAFIGGGIMASAALLLPGCQSLPGFSLNEAVRRLLTLSSQNAFAQLLQPGGFYDNELDRIPLPDQFGQGGAIIGAVLRSAAFRNQLQRQLNIAAYEGAQRAAPLVTDAIRNASFTDATAILRGGPQAATGFLRGRLGTALITAMVPEIGGALRLAQNDVVSQAIRAVSGVDVQGIASSVARSADNVIWSAIGREEASIRANPRATNDPLLIGALGIGGAL
ncbi:DUF4197 domain-containing protein [Novosphingopyxis baekryungensis]|uniref:DUF4197 domain-containing protein n=1 Tax=Novosphingopyxis baekryungensis TaxID=279369 RepID=UPI0003FE333E|nr:DUF4197 domain-containing protein [Novosphingopyxis baekryungensis]